MNTKKSIISHYALGSLVLFLALSHDIKAQQTEIAAIREFSMSEVTANSSDGTYRYYKEGEAEPFTGVLYAQWENGNFKSRQEFIDGVGEGKWINYWPNGNLKEVGTYQQNIVEGPIKKYYESGKLKASGNYKDWRIRIGEWKYYKESGELTLTENYGTKGDFRDVEEYYKSGQISKEQYLKIVNQ